MTCSDGNFSSVTKLTVIFCILEEEGASKVAVVETPKLFTKIVEMKISPEPKDSLGEIGVIKRMDLGSKVMLGTKVHPQPLFQRNSVWQMKRRAPPRWILDSLRRTMSLRNSQLTVGVILQMSDI